MRTFKKKDLAILLSRLHPFSAHRADLEQYQTECEIAADVLWNAYLAGHVEGKTVADLGCGTGILGFGAALLGAKKVYLVDTDERALAVARKNKLFLTQHINRKLPCTFRYTDVRRFAPHVDTVLQNPPFGVQNIHADQVFLLSAMRCGEVVYSFHKYDTRPFIERFVAEHGFHAVLVRRYDFPLKKTLAFHRKKVHFVDVGVWRLAH